MQLSTNLRRIRRERNLTQEKLAAILGVVPQSVSKWECGDGLPDITLIPALASALNVTTDDLFGMDETRRAQRLKEIKSSFKSDNRENADMLREAVKELPREWELWFWLASMLMGSGEKENQEAIAIADRMVEECNDGRWRNAAIFMLVHIYSEYLHDDVKVKEYLAQMPKKNSSYEYMVYNYMRGEERQAFIEAEIEDTCMHIDLLTQSIIGGINYNSGANGTMDGSVSDMLELYDLGLHALELLKGKPYGGNWAAQCARNRFLAANQFLELGETELALDLLEQALPYCEPYEGEQPARMSLSKETYHDGETTVVPSENAREMLLVMLDQSAEYGGEDSFANRLKGNPRYEAVLEKLKMKNEK